jgi:Fe-S-cluster containining protein
MVCTTPSCRYEGQFTDWVTSFSGSTFCCLENCDLCCRRTSGVGLTAQDHQRIGKNISNISFAEKRDHPIFPYKLRVNDKGCIFLSSDGACQIYPVRPILCRLYPLQLHIKWDGRILWCRERCPGVNSPNGTPLNREYMESLVCDILTSEGEAFFDTLREYVLEVKKPLTPLFGFPGGVVYTDWPTKERMWGIIMEWFHNEILEALTPRGRLESIRHDLLPPIQRLVGNRASWLPSEGVFCASSESLEEICEEYRMRLPERAMQSLKVQRTHENNLAKRGELIYGSKNGSVSRPSRYSKIRVHRLNGEEVGVKVDRLMHGLPIRNEAMSEEENYFEELVKREGRYGNEITDLTVDSELFVHLRIADSIELKANAFSIFGEKYEIDMEDMKEAICVVERTLTGMLRAAAAAAL